MKLNIERRKIYAIIIIIIHFFLSNKSFAIHSPVYREIVITSKYGYRNIQQKNEYHKGIDIRAKYEPVRAILSGKVKYGKNKGYGNYIEITTGKIRIIYAHLFKVRKIKMVKEGDIIAISGNSGRSFAPHLHITLYVNGNITDPTPLIQYIYYKEKLKNFKFRKDSI